MNHLPVVVVTLVTLFFIGGACGSSNPNRGPELKTGNEQALEVEKTSRKAEADGNTGVIYASSGKTAVGGDAIDSKDKPTPEPVVVGQSPAPVKLELNADGALLFDEADTDLEKLKPVFAKAATDAAPVVIIAAKAAGTDKLSAIFAAAFEAGVAVVTVERQVGDSTPPPPVEPPKK